MDTVTLAFEEFGVVNAPPLLILHGFFASSRNWRQIAEKLAVSYHIYVLDLRNHGASPHHALMNYPAMAADVLAFMNQHGLTTAHLLGHSMGGKVAMWFALNHPERVAKLLVVDIAPISYQHSFDPLIKALIALPLANITNRKQAKLALATAIPDLSYRQFLLQNLVLSAGHYCWRVDLAIFQRMAANIVAFPAVDERRYYGDTLFIAGAESNYVHAEQVKALFPTADFIAIANAGHWLHVQQPIAFIASVQGFLG